jgi:hypothetical protein
MHFQFRTKAIGQGSGVTQTLDTGTLGDRGAAIFMGLTLDKCLATQSIIDPII